MVRFLGILILLLLSGFYHPVHVSVSTIDMDVKTGVIAISIKLFSDDFETIVNHSYNTRLAISEQVDPGKDIKYINQYISSAFSLAINGEDIAELNYLKNQMNEESIWLFYEYECENKIRSVRIVNSLMNDLYSDQTNLVIVTYQDQQNGYRLNNKNTEISFKI